MLNKREDISLHKNNDLQIKMSNAIRALSMDAVQKANSGHPGMPMGMADVATVLFSEFLKFNPKNPNWSDRDRFILSAGHGSMLLYSLLHLTGYEDITLDEIKNFRQLGAKTAGHPEYGYAAGIETTTGPLGQGLANSVGFAIAEKMLASRYGDKIVDHFTYVIAGDGCLMEGISHEAISMAGHLGLEKLIVLFDDNKISIDGSTDLSVSDNQLERFKASNWHVQEINGHNFDEIREAIINAKNSDKPSMIACKTKIAFGSPNKEGTSASHGSPLGDEEILVTKKQLSWQYDAFEIPSDVKEAWQQAGEKSVDLYNDWCKRFDGLDDKVKDKFNSQLSGNLPDNFDEIISNIKKEYFEQKPKWATRKSSGEVLARLCKYMECLVGGSADLTGSNLTKNDYLSPISCDDFSGRYIYYGVREHAMAAAMNGIALHKGFIPYGGTFLVFTDYCKPAIRLSALMKQRVVYVMTHDSIGLGEDGPTHQPIEHLASLRTIPNCYTYRPCDAIETLECWQLALSKQNAPSILALTRQGLPTIRDCSDENKCAKGAYILADADSQLQATIYATGSEVEIALNAKLLLEKENIGTRIVSVPCVDLFEEQEESYKNEILADCKVKVAVEAGCKTGWSEFIGRDGIFIGMNSFGESAPANLLYKKFGITAENIAKKIIDKLK